MLRPLNVGEKQTPPIGPTPGISDMYFAQDLSSLFVNRRSGTLYQGLQLSRSGHHTNILCNGASVADTYLQTPGWRVRGVSRNPSSAAAEKWTSQGVEMVKGSHDDVDSLKSAFKDADVIFGVTDFWTTFQDPESQKKKRPDQELVQYCYEVELQQARNLADAAASVPSLGRFIFSSMADAMKWSKGKFSQLYHMDSKAQGVYYMQSLAGLEGKFSQVQAPIYFQLPWQWGLPTTPQKVC